MPTTDKEFAFDVKLWAVCRVKAPTQAKARKKMLDRLNCLAINLETPDGVKITEASIEDDSGKESELIEIDGEAV
ncbi:MAG: hypothetical protein ACXWML_09855 [Candidatus Binataceae bacterium]